MTTRSHIPFVDGDGQHVDALDEAQIVVSSASLAWSGVHAEAGHNDHWEVDELGVAEHYLALNIDDHPLHFDVLDGAVAREVVLPPGSLWFCPAGESFSHRVRQPNRFALVTLAPARVAQAFGDTAPRSLARTYGIVDPTLEHLVRAFVAEAERGGPGGIPFIDALATAAAVRIATAFSSAAPAPLPKGGLAPAVLRRITALVRERLAAGISINELAAAANLSPAHFARAFKQSTGEAPHQYVIGLRLDAARRALDTTGAQIADVAIAHGFTDQAHFTRLFKKRFGVTPGAVARDRRR